MMRFTLGVLAYVVPTFALGFVWHLVLFEDYYRALAIYRSEIIIPLGLLSMLIQAVIFAWIYERSFARREGTVLTRAASYAALGAVLSWSFTTLAVAAKNVMASVPDYLLIAWWHFSWEQVRTRDFAPRKLFADRDQSPYSSCRRTQACG
jgi:hypothetical protein